ncbi:MAG TPA: hypothetical protein VFH83_12180 [Spirochaetia bacterium]|nr:hypothetical protein [Spirochaetia bacterium]
MIKRPEDPRAKGGQQNPYGDKNPQTEFRDYTYVLYVPDTGS